MTEVFVVVFRSSQGENAQPVNSPLLYPDIIAIQDNFPASFNIKQSNKPNSVTNDSRLLHTWGVTWIVSYMQQYGLMVGQ
jgi:hypothetical protein